MSMSSLYFFFPLETTNRYLMTISFVDLIISIALGEEHGVLSFLRTVASNQTVSANTVSMYCLGQILVLIGVLDGGMAGYAPSNSCRERTAGA